jgi:endogenous inhibitor of DNA gyrase (YacG/DUF329 family)
MRTRIEHPICHPCRRKRNPVKPSKPRPPLQLCGTHGAYLRHWKRGERCDVCRRAEADRKYAQQPSKTGRRLGRRGSYGFTSYMTLCEECGKEYKKDYKSRRFCSKACANANWRKWEGSRAASKASTRARRLRHSETWDGVTDEQIFERDGWQCLIPGCDRGLLRRDLMWPDPLSPSIDHIVPLSRGGTDAAPNKRAAHATCNIRRYNRMTPEEEGLVMPELAPLGLLAVTSRLRACRCGCHKGPDLLWPRRVHYRTCQFCAVEVRSAQPAKRSITVCRVCSQGKCSSCGDDMFITVGSRSPETRLCNNCRGGHGRHQRLEGAPRRRAVPPRPDDAKFWWTTVRPDS